MVTLFCFCCDHRNPAGARFCNACGTPLHLKPCKHCDAINTRAAAHCHKCGETFALEFLALDEVAERPEVPESAPVPAPVEATAPPSRQGVFRTRIVALAPGHDGHGAAIRVFRLPAARYRARRGGHRRAFATRGSSGRRAAPPEAPPLATFTPPTAARSPLPSSEPSGAGAGPARAGDVKEADAAGSCEGPGSIGPPDRQTKRTGERRQVESRASPAGCSPDSIGAGRGDKPAGGPSSSRGAVVTGPGPDRAADDRYAARSTCPVGGRWNPVRRHHGERAQGGQLLLRRAWDRPCAEGVALDPACDVRMMPKGN